RQHAADRMREPDVRDQPAAEKRADASPRPIEELIWHDDVEWLVLFFEAADSARRENPLDAEHLEPVNIRAEVELRWQDAMAHTVPREKRDAACPQRADHVGPRRIAKRRRDDLFFAVDQLRHVVEAAPADDSN